MPCSLGDVVAIMDRLYDPAWAAPWDAVGLVCGDPEDEVTRVLLAVDPVTATVDEAIESGAQLLITHHPLLLSPVHGVSATTPKGRLVHRMIRAGVGHLVAHTNADSANPGVSDALADLLGLVDLQPLSPQPAESMDTVVTFVPTEHAEEMIDALAAAGAGAIGFYSRCAWLTPGTGTFRPDADATPAIGAAGVIERVAETRVEMVLPRERRAAVRAALLAAHPYEEPAYDILEFAELPGRRGTGRIGWLPTPVPFADFVSLVERVLPDTPAGVRAAGDPAAMVSRVAVCGGAGDSLLAVAHAAGVDAYVTGDLRHHRASEHLEAGGPALVDPGHWASEWPWLPAAAALLSAALPPDVQVRVSRTVTDPWTVSAGDPWPVS